MTDKIRKKSDPHLYFQAALSYFLKDKSKYSQKQIASDAGISGPYVSQLASGARFGSVDVQQNISKALGYELAAFLQKGKEVLTCSNATAKTSMAEIRESQPVYSHIPIDMSAADPLVQAIGDLKEIFYSKNDVLIKAIQANLSAFKHAAQAEKEKLKMQTRMEKRIKRLEDENKALKGCAGDSPPLDLSPDRCGLTGTEDPET